MLSERPGTCGAASSRCRAHHEVDLDDLPGGAGLRRDASMIAGSTSEFIFSQRSAAGLPARANADFRLDVFEQPVCAG